MQLTLLYGQKGIGIHGCAEALELEDVRGKAAVTTVDQSALNAVQQGPPTDYCKKRGAVNRDDAPLLELPNGANAPAVRCARLQ